MNKKIYFFNNNVSNDEFDISNLVLESLNLLKNYYEKSKNDEKLIYKKGDDFNYLNNFFSLSTLWLDKKINLFYDLLELKIDRIEIAENEFDLLKYHVDFYWYNSELAQILFDDQIYNLFNKKNEYILENKNTCFDFI